MSEVTIKEDIHISKDNFTAFKQLKKDFDVVLAEVKRERPTPEWKDFDSITGKIFFISLFLFFRTLGRGQRNEEPSSDVETLDLEFDEMPMKLTMLDKVKLMIFPSLAVYLSIVAFDISYGVWNFVIICLGSLLFILFYFVSFVMVIDERREERMAYNISKSLDEENRVLAYLGGAHSRGVKNKLENKGFNVNLDYDSDLAHLLSYYFSMLRTIFTRPLIFLKRRY